MTGRTGFGALPWWAVATALICASGCSRSSTPADAGPDGGGPPSPTGPVSSWTLTDLGTGRCVAVNDQGLVLGTDDTEATFLVSRGGSRTMLGKAPDGSMAIGVALDQSGNVVGYSLNAQGRHALEYSGGSWKTLDAVSAPWSAAAGLDDSGHIVGMAGVGQGAQMQAFLLESGAPVDLALNVTNSAGYLVHGSLVAGVLQTGSGQTHAFVKRSSGVVDLGSLGGPNSMPYAMNAKGDVVGAAETAAGPRHAFLALADAAATDLGVPQGGISSEARGVNGAGQVAGNVYDMQHRSRPVVFVPGGTAMELLPTDSTNPYFSAHVVGMSPAGYIVGWGQPSSADAGSMMRCLLWTPGA